MAVKPNDCIIKIEDLVVGKKRVLDHGHGWDVLVHEKYWENFLEHVGNKSKEVKTDNWKVNPYDVVFNEELKKYGATFKETKNWKDRYVKFKSHKNLTMFILRWS